MFRQMRRIKQLLDKNEAREILRNSSSGVLALTSDDDSPYLIPLCYVYQDGEIYFRSAKSSHKIEKIKKYDKASFCIINQDHVIPEEFTTYFKSIVAFGRIHILEDETEIKKAVKLLEKKYSKDSHHQKNEIENSFNNICIIKMHVDSISGKQAKELLKETA